MAGADQGGAVTSHAAAEKTLSYGPPLVTSPWRHMPRVTSAQRHTAPLAARPAMHVKTSLSRELGGRAASWPVRGRRPGAAAAGQTPPWRDKTTVVSSVEDLLEKHK
ncbi:hypothetical protein E2C01_022476 [Portunus trituberculatus]|uniref:Uncharacterized protein n=1 Tax=Portunus trituberculatus TaxID=210409 RepID=A0A5B7E5F7_PORTR|nr:hypothetical protein [Portunus trituberculatus]